MNAQAQTTSPVSTIQCCKESLPPQSWDEGGVCCGDGEWHADRGDGGTTCSDFNLQASKACVVPPASPTDGCRAPTEVYDGVSCESCCDQNMDDCIEHSGDEWYNSVRFLPNADCPTACPRCASCSIRAEENLKALAVPPQCNPADCADMNIGIDPCFARDSCECFCETANNLLENCPQITPDWLVLEVDQCANKECGEVCENPCPAGAMCPTVIYYCQQDGSCGMNAAPECPDKESSGKKIVLSAGEVCCDYPGNSLELCSSTCGDGLECVFYGQQIGAPTCEISGEVMDTVHWTLKGPWELKAIQGEYDTLLAVFAQMLSVPPFSTFLMIQRVDGIVEIVYTLVANTQTTELLNDPDFKFRFEQNIAQENPDLARSMFINESDVVAMFVLEGIWDIGAVEEQQEILRSYFSFVLGMNPDMVETEITSGEGKMTEIIYKAKGNAMQIDPLYDGAKFSSDLKTYISDTNPGLARILHIHAKCPQEEPSEMHMCVGSLRCDYGEQCCCGSCIPKITYMCYGGLWAAMKNDDCLLADCTEFPEATGLKLNTPREETPVPLTQQTNHESNNLNATHVAIIVASAVVLGIFAGLLMHWLNCFSVKQGSNDHNTDVYHDISLGTKITNMA